MIKYTGVGSRKTPPAVLLLMEDIGGYLARKGAILRSGHAEGADLAFETGCDRFKGQKEIFAPWKGFNGSSTTYYDPPNEAYGLAAKVHPAWGTLTIGNKKLHARNAQQVLGPNLTNPSTFVVYWTPKGEERGGTATAIKIAKMNNIPLIDLYNKVIIGNSNHVVEVVYKEIFG